MNLIKLTYPFTNILSTLAKNQSLIKQTSVIENAKTDLQPLLTVDDAYFLANSSHHDISELKIYATKNQSNPSLSKGNEYDEYPLQKLIHIGLSKIQNSQDGIEDWKSIESSMKSLIRNTSITDNIHLLTIASNKIYPFQQRFTHKIINLLTQQLKYMNHQNKNWLFFNLCNLDSSPDISYALNALKAQVSSMILQSKMNQSYNIQWIALNSFINKVSTSTILHLLKKNCKDLKQMKKNQLLTVLQALNHRKGLQNSQDFYQLQKIGQKLIEKNQKIIQSDQNQVQMKMNLHLVQPFQKQFILTADEMMSCDLSVKDQLTYLAFLWKYDLINSHELIALYKQIQIEEIKSGFTSLPIIMSICQLQLGLGLEKNHDHINQWINSIQYIPRGLQWILWNYGQKNKNQSISQLLKQTYEKKNISKIINQERSKIQKINDIKEFKKFLHAIRVWQINPVVFLKPTLTPVHFANHQYKFILHCYQNMDLIEGKIPHNECLLNQQLIRENLGYEFIGIKMNEFMNLQYNERISLLKEKIKGRKHMQLTAEENRGKY